MHANCWLKAWSRHFLLLNARLTRMIAEWLEKLYKKPRAQAQRSHFLRKRQTITSNLNQIQLLSLLLHECTLPRFLFGNLYFYLNSLIWFGGTCGGLLFYDSLSDSLICEYCVWHVSNCIDLFGYWLRCIQVAGLNLHSRFAPVGKEKPMEIRIY